MGEFASPENSDQRIWHPFQTMDYSYLRPPTKVFRPMGMADIFDPESDRRVVFFDNAPTQNELELVRKFKIALKNEKNIALPVWWEMGESLRLLDQMDNNVSKTIDLAHKYMNFVAELKHFNISPEAEKYLRTGVISIHGRDKKGQPCILMNIKDKIDKKTSQGFTDAIKFCMLVVRKYCLVNKYCEKFNLLVNLNAKNMIPPLNLIKPIIDLFQNNFNTFIDKTYLYNRSRTFKMVWAIVKKFVSAKDLESVFTVDKGHEAIF